MPPCPHCNRPMMPSVYKDEATERIIDESGANGVGREVREGECNRRSATGYRRCLELEVEILRAERVSQRTTIILQAKEVFFEFKKSLEEINNVQKDNPENDGTDAAHPAWWRGEKAGVEGICHTLNKVLDIKASPFGSFANPLVQQTMNRIWKELKPIPPIVVPYSAATNRDLSTVQMLTDRIWGWTYKVFGIGVTQHKYERMLRLIEEILELGQAVGVSVLRAQDILNYVYRRPVGKIEQEIGGVMLTFLAFCRSVGLNPIVQGQIELDRVEQLNPASVREKQAMKVRMNAAWGDESFSKGSGG